MHPLIEHIRRFVPLPDEEASELLSYFTPVQAKKKEVLLREGAPCRKHYFVSSGCLRLCYTQADGSEHTTQFALEGWWLTDLDAWSSGAAARFSIVAVEASDLLALDRSAEEALLQRFPQLERYFRLLFRRVAAAAQWYRRVHNEHSAEEHFRSFCAQYPDFVQRVPQYLLASFLGITPEYLSILRRRALLKRD